MIVTLASALVPALVPATRQPRAATPAGTRPATPPQAMTARSALWQSGGPASGSAAWTSGRAAAFLG